MTPRKKSKTRKLVKQKLTPAMRKHNRSVRIYGKLTLALDAYVADQRGRPATPDNVALVVACTNLKCLLRGLGL